LALPTLKWAGHGNSPGSLVLVADAGEPEGTRKAAPGERRDKPSAGAKTDAEPEIEYLPRPTKDEERILKALATPIDVEFLDLPLEDALVFINEYPNLP